MYDLVRGTPFTCLGCPSPAHHCGKAQPVHLTLSSYALAAPSDWQTTGQKPHNRPSRPTFPRVWWVVLLVRRCLCHLALNLLCYLPNRRVCPCHCPWG